MSAPPGPDLYQRLDQGLARVERGASVVVLLSMVLVASLQALFFNIAERHVEWAQAMLDGLSWADNFLQKGTLWLAFIGASLATQQDNHIAIDIVPRFAPPRVSRALRTFAAFGSGLIAFVLAGVFYQACVVADASVPFDYAILTSTGPMHICDAPVAELSGSDPPSVLCVLRSSFSALGVPVNSGGGVAQLIAPLMFVVIGLRLLARALYTVLNRNPKRRVPKQETDTAETDTAEAGEDPGEANPPERE